MDNTNISQDMEYLQGVPVISVPNALRVTPEDHVEGLYYYPIERDGKSTTIVVNTDRNQWYANDSAYGDDAASLALYFVRAMGHQLTDDHILSMFASEIAEQKQESTERITCQSLPILAPQCIAKPYGKHIGDVFIPGLSKPVLKEHCMVVYKLKDREMVDSKLARKYSDMIANTDDLTTLQQMDRQMIINLFSVSLAMKNVHGGFQLYRDGSSHPEKAAGYCLIGDDEVEKGETCYVFENIVDYLALMEMRYKNGTSAIMPPDHHLIINGKDNMDEAMDFLHTRCDFMRVVTLFPNDEEGRALFDSVKRATHQTARDGSEPYTSLHYFSMSAKAAGKVDAAAVAAERKQLEGKVAAEIAAYNKEHVATQKRKEDDETSKKNQKRTVTLPSPERHSLADRFKKNSSGFKM